MRRPRFFQQRLLGPLLALMALPFLATACSQPTVATDTPPPPEVTRPAPATLAPLASATGSAETALETEEEEAPQVEPTLRVRGTPTLRTQGGPATEGFAPGQRDVSYLEAEASRVYPYSGVQFHPVVVFAQAAAGLDLAVEVYDRPVDGPGEAAAVYSANFDGPGRPEIVVYSARQTTEHSIVLTAASGSGDYRVHLFDTLTAAPWLTLREEQLDAGSSGRYEVASLGAGQVIAFAEPVNQADLILRILGPGGAVISEANFAGPGSAEAIFVSAMSQTDYVIEVAEASQGAADFRLAVAVLEEIN